jgi:hypothetical protein
MMSLREPVSPGGAAPGADARGWGGASRAEDASTDLLHHARAIRECTRRLGLEAHLDLANFRLALRGHGRYYDLFPQFSVFDDQRGLQYRPTPDGPGNVRFIGWLPYFNKYWAIARDKLPFKEFCTARGLRTPAYWTRRDDAVRDVIVKNSRSSFGAGMRGPFRLVGDGDAATGLFAGEYYEQFVIGTIAKAWYWDERPVCLETCAMPSVTGDGRRSTYELAVAGAPRSRVPLKRSDIETLARYQGVHEDEILPAGRTVITDFRYTSPLLARGTANQNVLPRYAGSEIERQLREAGTVLWQAVPEELRKGTVWTLDAIIEEDEARVWLLEMNCNPTLHPDTYPAMVDALFGPDADQVLAAAKKAMQTVMHLPSVGAGRPGAAAPAPAPAVQAALAGQCPP